MEVTIEQLKNFAQFVTDFNDKKLSDEDMAAVYGFFCDWLNTNEAIESYLICSEIIDVKELWGEDLYSLFSAHISSDGWLTSSWSDVLDREISRFDENYHDNPEYENTYSKMYLMDFTESNCGRYIRPVIE